jgi:hypothetical protein
MLKLELGLQLFSNIQIIVLVPVYLCLSPLCMISSSLFDWTMSHIIDDQTITLISILILEWTVSFVLIFQLIRDRTGKAIFFYEFVFFLTCSNFILIGVTYSLLKRDNIYEELTAKICTSLLLILIAEKVKLKYEEKKEETCCTICFEKMNNDWLILKCKHEFHETCLWNWVYVKQECPYCKCEI